MSYSMESQGHNELTNAPIQHKCLDCSDELHVYPYKSLNFTLKQENRSTFETHHKIHNVSSRYPPLDFCPFSRE